MSQPELSIVIPFLNEEQVLPLLRERLEKIRNRPVAWELLFVSDGSTDGSTTFIEAWARAAPYVKLVVLTRNFGHQSAISDGLSFASGNCVGIMDADLQDEPGGSPGNVSGINRGESGCGLRRAYQPAHRNCSKLIPTYNRAM
jgi:glycosyltransferase involved in cell wall biosynthesis